MSTKMGAWAVSELKKNAACLEGRYMSSDMLQPELMEATTNLPFFLPPRIHSSSSCLPQCIRSVTTVHQSLCYKLHEGHSWLSLPYILLNSLYSRYLNFLTFPLPCPSGVDHIFIFYILFYMWSYLILRLNLYYWKNFSHITRIALGPSKILHFSGDNPSKYGVAQARSHAYRL